MTALILFTVVAVVALFSLDTRKQGILALILCVAITSLAPHIQVPKHPQYKVALIQPSIPQDQKWDASFVRNIMFKLVLLSEQAADADLIIWPESAVPMYLSENPGWDAWLKSNSDSWHATLVFGGLHLLPQGKAQNGLYLMQKKTPYRQFAGKHHLVPFGEYVPAWLPFLNKIMPELADFHPATDDGILIMNEQQGAPQKLGSIICYESLFPEEAFKRVRLGAHVLVVVTNDAWYGKSPAAWQHFQASQVRAIENGRYVLRATNTGISAIIAPDGSIQKTMPWWEEGMVRGKYQPLSHQTLYQKWGDIPILTLVFFALGVAVFQTYRREKWL